jgi:hypothetical protein
MKKKQNILFSCAGTTDPARGGYDGSLLHVIRHYRPEKICLFLSPEMSQFEEQDGRYTKMLELAKSWEGYCPEMALVHSDLKDASDLDELDEPLHQAVSQFADQYPDGQMLLNLSSGTPQMKTILEQIVLDLRYNAIGIQVKTPEKKASTSRRSNDRHYDVDEELEMAEMEESTPEADNRCSEPKLFAMRRAMQWQQVEALLSQRNYAAIATMKTAGLSPTSIQLAQHLAARNQLQTEEAHRLARGLNLGFSLYPVKCSPSDDYKEVSEYFLMVKNLQMGGRLTDFTLRLNPLVIRLQEALLNQLLEKSYGTTLPDLMAWNDRAGRKQLSPLQLLNRAQPLYKALDQRLLQLGKDSFRDSDPSIYIYNRLLECSPDTPDFLIKLFTACERLNQSQRNLAAHTLYGITEEMLTDEAQMSSAVLVRQLEQAMIAIYPECDPALFNLYQKCGEYIRRHR